MNKQANISIAAEFPEFVSLINKLSISESNKNKLFKLFSEDSNEAWKRGYQAGQNMSISEINSNDMALKTKLNYINIISMDIGVPTDKARSVLNMLWETFFDKSQKGFLEIPGEKEYLIENYTNISNMLLIVSDYLFEVSKTIQEVEEKES